MRRALPSLTVLACALAAAGSAHAGVTPGGTIPRACQNAAYGDRVGTAANDRIVAAPGSERVFGLDSPDWLIGSDTVASCLFGGAADDVLTMTAPGGVGLGEEGDDVISGAGGPDALTGGSGADLIAAAAGNDVLRGGTGIDGLNAGAGDDIVEDADGKGEVLDCGAGTDTVIADRKDVLLNCEEGSQSGKEMTAYPVTPERGNPRRVFRTGFRVPRYAEDGAYRVLISSRCAPGLRELRRFPAVGGYVNRGEVVTVALRPPSGGWCTGPTTGLVVRQPECLPGSISRCSVPLPIEVIGRFALRVRPRF